MNAVAPGAPSPWPLVAEWLPANDDVERPQIQVATISTEGGPDIRTVLLTEWDESGFYFHTDATSRKVADIRADPRVAIEMLWPGFTKQLVILGTAEEASADEQQRAYAKRSPYLKQLAWQNSHEFAQKPREQRTAEWAAFLDTHDATELEPPPTWIGFLVRPTRLTFWQSDAEAASLRTEYRLGDDGWEVAHLPG